MFWSFTFLLVCLYAPLISTYREDLDPTTVISNGRIVGVNLPSRRGRIFSAYRGIPYAKPPIGHLRFKEPQEADKWNHTFFATKDAPKCAQKNYLFGEQKVEGSEDCLYINVYTPLLEVQNVSEEELLPVMVFIHWGGFFSGYSGSEYLGPEYIMDKDVILVTFNYRLGVLGFFSTYNDAAPGNFGFKDQNMALQWVQKNIKYFGGCKNKVTLFGQSAGGASVHYHMLSELSRDLFQRAISESGTALALWAQPFDGRTIHLPEIQAKLVNCNHTLENSSELVECLRSVDVKTLINSGDKFKFFSIDPLTIYLPSIEVKTEKNPKPFITEHPLKYIESGNFMNISWIVGVVSDEGLIRASALWSQSHLWETLVRKFDKLMPNMIMLGNSVPKNKIEEIWKRIKQFYFEHMDSSTTYQSLRGLIDLYTDRAFHYSTYQSILLHLIKDHHPLRFYKFAYKGEFSYKTHFSGVNATLTNYIHGPCHCDDLLYLFKSKALFPEAKNKNDQKMIDSIVELWTNFAIYGEPTPPGSFIHIPEWDSITNSKTGKKNELIKNMSYLHIGGIYNNDSSVIYRMENGIFNERLRFWEELPLVENIGQLNQNHEDL